MILDTNAISDLVNGNELIHGLLKGELYVPVIVLGEYHFGLLGSTGRDAMEQILGQITHLCSPLLCDLDTAANYAEIRRELKSKGKPIPENDIWIAALCRQHRMPLLSRDAHFDVVDGLKRLSW